MKNKKVTPLAPIIFKLNNMPPNGDTYRLIFSSVAIIIKEDEATMIDFFEYMNYFSIDNFNVFGLRVMETRNKELNMNQQHLILFYATVHLMIELMGSTKHVEIMRKQVQPESLEIFEAGRDEMVEFCKITNNTLRKDYKNNNAIIVAFAKIDGYRIIEQ